MRHGEEVILPPDRNGRTAHTWIEVHTEMFVQICRDYHSLPDPRTLTGREIRFYYDGLRAELIQQTKTKG